MAEKRIFRQAALDRLASPEQLDHLVPAVDARGWLALAACAGLALAVLAWSVAGSLPVTVAARGLLSGDGRALLYLPATAAAIRPGMPVLLRPASGGSALHGTVERAVPAGAGHAAHVAVHVTVHVTSPVSGHAGGTPVEADIELSRRRPIAFLLPGLR